MKEKMTYLELGEKKYPICFNLNVMADIQEEYGSMKKWGEVVEGGNDGEPNIKDLMKGLLAMINEGIDIENEEKEKKMSFLTPRQVGRIITNYGLEEVIEKIKSLTHNSMPEDEGKNE